MRVLAWLRRSIEWPREVAPPLATRLAFSWRRTSAGAGIPGLQPSSDGLGVGSRTDGCLAERESRRSGIVRLAFWRDVLFFFTAVDLYGTAPIWTADGRTGSGGDFAVGACDFAILFSVRGSCSVDL